MGGGPVGVRAAAEILRHAPGSKVTLCSAEADLPYNRVNLSAYLSGECSRNSLYAQHAALVRAQVDLHADCRISRIYRDERIAVDGYGNRFRYEQLVLATGARLRWPKDIIGLGRPGVFTFRNLADADKLAARRLRSRHTVVIGGGLLGLETARAMRRFNTDICVIEQNERIMFHQLDGVSARCLQNAIEAQKIEVRTGTRVVEACGRFAIESLRLSDGTKIPCDTLIIAIGIVPNIDLAMAAGLPVGRGIKVDNRMRTADPRIFAVGECAEHEGRVYGLVAPGLEQASVAAATICGRNASYGGSLAQTTLKVLSIPVFSAGQVANRESGVHLTRYASGDDCTRVLVTKNGRCVGAAGIGSWPDQRRVSELVRKQGLVWPWQRFLFRKTGSMWLQGGSDRVGDWPATTTICNCVGVSRGAISAAIEGGSRSIGAIAAATRASTVCASCKPMLQSMLDGGAAQTEPVPAHRPILAFSMLCAVAAAAGLLLPDLPYLRTIQVDTNYNLLWTSSAIKQLSGFTLLGLSLAAALLSVRKRLRRVKWFRFSSWRLVHTGLGVATIAAILAHTGFRLGSNLNALLMFFFVLALLSGGGVGVAVAMEHRVSAQAGRLLRKAGVWLHLILLWPLPLLLGFHVLKTYYF